MHHMSLYFGYVCSLLATLRYHGGWIFKKNVKNLFFTVQIEKTKKISCRKNGEKSLFTFYNKEKNYKFLNLMKSLTAR